MPGFYCDEAEDKTYIQPRCEICGKGTAIDYLYIDGKKTCLSCLAEDDLKSARERKKRQIEYENILKIARENEKRAKGGS